MEFKDYYSILGVEPEADTATIKSAYRKLARKYPPDLNADPEAEARFKEVAEAWEVLKDEGRRAEYDELRRMGGRRAGGFEPPPGWQSSAGGEYQHFSGDFSDFFNSIFGGGFDAGAGPAGGHASGRRASGWPGQDVEIELPVFLEETLAKQSRPVEYRIPVVEGGQRRELHKSLKVTVPAGVADGARIRVRGQGAPGSGGAPDGDLYLHVRLVPHPLFDVEGHNLVISVPLAPWEAALGARVDVPTLEGRIRLSVPAGSQSGQKLRVSGKGLPGPGGRGDLLAVLRIVLPKEAGPEQQALWEQLAAANSGFDPRAGWER